MSLVGDYASLQVVLRYGDLPTFESGTNAGKRIIVASLGKVARWSGSAWVLSSVDPFGVEAQAAVVLPLDDDTAATPDAELDIVAAAAGACAGAGSPSAANVDTAIATAVAPLDINFATVSQQLNAILTALKNAGIMASA